jgi:hypothetical protein
MFFLNPVFDQTTGHVHERLNDYSPTLGVVKQKVLTFSEKATYKI